MSDQLEFFMVAGRGPTYERHDTLKDAEEEAIRLAENKPGIGFAVLTSVKTYTHSRGAITVEVATNPADFQCLFEPLDRDWSEPIYFDMQRVDEFGGSVLVVVHSEDDLAKLLNKHQSNRMRRVCIEEFATRYYVSYVCLLRAKFFSADALMDSMEFKERVARRRKMVRKLAVK